ncbi:LysM-like peptidoglycan-binding domain-containing protein [Klebsiella quasipneumoniae]
MPGRFELTSTLAKIWHAPDHFRLLDPLPPMHRRGIIAGFLLVIIGILLPSDDSQNPASASREANLNLQSQSQPQAGGNQAVPLPPITNTPTVSDADQMAPVAPEPIQDEQPDQAQTQQSAPGIEQQWRTYRIESGKTLAQLFRDHGLPATDVYAMAQVEGAGKPLSTLQSGQTVQIRQNANGVVTGLTIDTGNGQQVLFTRQSNGSFVRAR